MRIATENIPLPSQVVQILGNEAATALEYWLNERLLENQQVPPIRISAPIARQKVNVLMLERVSNLLLADEPRLIPIDETRWVWRVPVDLTYPEHGRVGRVAEIDVDAMYGTLTYDDKKLKQIANKTKQLANKILGEKQLL